MGIPDLTLKLVCDTGMQRPAEVWQIAFQHHLSLHSVATAIEEMYALPMKSNAALRRLLHSIAEAGSTLFSCCRSMPMKNFQGFPSLKTPLIHLFRTTGNANNKT